MADDLIGRRWNRVHKRIWDMPGGVLDIGCAGWQWSRQFIGQKEVVGYDPQETQQPEGTILVRKAVGTHSGTARLYGKGIMASVDLSTSGSVSEVPMVAIREVLAMHAPLAAVKLNIEGGEYVLLPEMQHPVTDQLVVSFHDWTAATTWRKPWTETIIRQLWQWYDAIQIDVGFNWWLFLRREAA